MSDEDRNILKNEEQDADVEGHFSRSRNDEGTEEKTQPNSDEEPDVEGHRLTPKTRI